MPATARVILASGELRSALTGADGMVTKYLLRQLREIRNRAVLYCPVDTGNLRASITQGVLRSEGMKVIGTVGTPVEYGLYVHEGYTMRTRKGSRHVAGRPFLRRAMEEVIDHPV